MPKLRKMVVLSRLVLAVERSRYVGSMLGPSLSETLSHPMRWLYLGASSACTCLFAGRCCPSAKSCEFKGHMC